MKGAEINKLKEMFNIQENYDLDEMAYKPGKMKDIRPQERGAKAFDKLIQSGGLDKKDYQKARQLYVQASDAASREKLKKFIYNLDTEPTEAIMDLIGKNDPDTFNKMYPKSKPGEYLSTISYAHRNVKAEEVELDEAMKYTHAVVDPDGKVAGMTTDEKDAKDIASRHKGKVVKLKKPIAQKVGDMMINRPLKEKETVVESWELDEMKMDDPKLLKIFDKLKKGSTVKIKIDSSISKGKDYREFTVTAKNIVGKGKKFEQEKITLKAKDNPTGVKHFLYNRDGKVTLAIGDMGASIADIKENKMSAYTAAITKGVK